MRVVKEFSGVIVPMVTPLTATLSIDENSVAQILKTFTLSRASVFVAGTTGESSSLSRSQKTSLVEFTLKHRSQTTPVYAGIAGNCLSESIEDGKNFASMGVDAIVAHLPTYYPVSDQSASNYFKQIADSVDCPLILYNIPALVGRSIPLDLVEDLSLHPNIVGLKDSERDVDRLDKAIGRWKERKDFTFLLGWAAQAARAVLSGADGIVPSTANLTPELYQDLFQFAREGKYDDANRLQDLTNKISKVYQQDKNISESIPALKVLMSVFGLCEPYVLSPMEMPGETEQKELESTITCMIKPGNESL